MLNPNEFDEVCAQAIHVESGGRPFNFTPKTSKQMETEYRKKKGKSNGNKTATAQKEDERTTCTHCQGSAMMKLGVGNFIRNSSQRSSKRRRVKRRLKQQSNKAWTWDPIQVMKVKSLLWLQQVNFLILLLLLLQT